MPAEPPQTGPADLAAFCALFAQRLRSHGVLATAGQAGRLAQAIASTEPFGLAELYWCAKVTLACRPEDFEAFDAAFAEVFGQLTTRLSPSGTAPAPAAGATRRGEDVPPSGDATFSSPAAGLAQRSPGEDATPTPTSERTGASRAEVLRSKELSDLSEAELALVAETVSEVLAHWPQRRSRRRAPRRGGAQVDLRRTLALSRRSGGEALRLARSERIATPLRAVLLVDVSGSMAQYAPGYLCFSHAAARAGHCEVFTFGTRLSRLTPAFSKEAPGGAVAAASRVALDRNGGTRISGSIETFLSRFGRRGMARGAIVVIFSDGWEQGDPAELGRQMAALGRIARRILWVNPRKAAPGYAALAGGMAAALPHCDAFLEGHSIAALEDVARALIGAGRGWPAGDGPDVPAAAAPAGPRKND